MFLKKDNFSIKEVSMFILFSLTLINNCKGEKSLGKTSNIETEQEALIASIWYLPEENPDSGIKFKKKGNVYNINCSDGFEADQLKERSIICENKKCIVKNNFGKIEFTFLFINNRTIEILRNNIPMVGEGGRFGLFKKGTTLVRIDPNTGRFLDYDDYVQNPHQK
ncbi:hypothetical protein [Leptospira interrogans]|uniref:Uncharacterized protein n=1 Tax=Leptospira interrogans str. UI 12621 TaxID=1049937 RepID=A0A0F6HFQ2_LEPIR|nr:hypothetical protein [Leptospira interrogans]EKO27202.1 hypothetical protein LEP1GSC104_0055 [Leptospira interrogans str. UI 12621]EMN81069.1 hypothetical protein LEP1GSC106_3736 [Leptospira interrogans serovar Grippotyphosa str. UI 12764]